MPWESDAKKRQTEGMLIHLNHSKIGYLLHAKQCGLAWCSCWSRTLFTKEGLLDIAGVVTVYNLENLATRRSVIPAEAESQQFRFTALCGNEAVKHHRLNPGKWKERREEREGQEWEEGEKRGSLVKGFLRPESPRMQGKQEVVLVMCVISTLWQSHRTWGTAWNAGRQIYMHWGREAAQ